MHIRLPNFFLKTDSGTSSHLFLFERTFVLQSRHHSMFSRIMNLCLFYFSPLHSKGEFVRTCSKDGQVLVWLTASGRRVPSSALGLRDTQWQGGWNSTLGWPVIGIWTGGSKGFDLSEIHTVSQGYGDTSSRLVLFSTRFECNFLSSPLVSSVECNF